MERKWEEGGHFRQWPCHEQRQGHGINMFTLEDREIKEYERKVGPMVGRGAGKLR